MKKTLAMAAGVLALAAMLPAHALVTARVAVGAPSIGIEDLDANDGIEARVIDGGYAAPHFFFELRPAAAGNEVYGDGLLELADSAVAGSASASHSGFLAVADLGGPSFTFSATPFTRVTVSVSYALDTFIDPAGVAGSETPNALASVELNLAAINNLRADEAGASGELLYDTLPYADGFRGFAKLHTFDGGAPAGALRRADTLQVSFDNLSATGAVFAFRAELVAFGNTAAVPEPATAALWLAGAALLAAGQRLRRREAR